MTMIVIERSQALARLRRLALSAQGFGIRFIPASGDQLCLFA